MELNVAFSCPCGAFVDQNLHVDMQESSIDTASDRDEEFYASVQCDGCGKDFEAQIGKLERTFVMPYYFGFRQARLKTTSGVVLSPGHAVLCGHIQLARTLRSTGPKARRGTRH